jgi:large subunit ribosomal protein L6
MSRIGNNPITVPETVNVSLQGSEIIVKGKLGELSQTIDSSISVSVNENIISLSRQSDNKDVRSKHGLYRALISNMIEGVINGHTKKT